KEIEIGDVHRDGGHPKDEVNGLSGDKFDQFGGEHGELIGDDHPSGALRDAEAEFERVGIEVNWGKTAHDFGAIQSEAFKRPIHKIYGVAMIERDAFRNTG